MCVDARNGRKGLLVHPGRVALPQERLEPRVRLEAEPCEILEKSDLVLRTAADSIVVLQAKQHATAERTRDAPDVDRIDDMTEMEITSGRWREARQGRRAQRRRQPCEIWTRVSTKERWTGSCRIKNT